MPTSRTLVALSLGALAAAAIAGTAGAHRNPAGETYRSAQAMSYELGSKRAIGYFVSQNGQCQVTLMVAEAVDPEEGRATSAARISVSMVPGQSATLDSEEGSSMVLTCGSGAETMKVMRTTVVRS
jgi:hypothetical protein